MKRLRGTAIKRVIAAGLLGGMLTAVIFAGGVIERAAIGVTSKLGRLSAALLLPEGAASAYRVFGDGQAQTTAHSASQTQTKPTAAPSASSAPAPTTAAGSTKATAQQTQPVGAEGYAGRVVTEQISNAGASLHEGAVYVANKAGVSMNLKTELAARPDVYIYKNKKPQVLIVHTHATESYFPEDIGYYKSSWSSRSTDNSKNVIRVGDEITKQLEAAGIVTIHDTTQHDKDSYNGSYDRSEATIKKYLAQYPSIDVVIDIHRDAIGGDGVKTKPTVVIDGKKAAQIMIATGCQTGSVTGYPDWRQNFRFALRVQQACGELYPGLARPMYFVAKKYNHYLTHGSILIEMGSEANTLEEAIYSGELLGKALVKALNALTVG